MEFQDKFKQIEENINALNLSEDSDIYDYAKYYRLVDAAKEARGISVFENCKTPEYSTLRLFKYQETAVETMLIDFEGRGVFGDQVGLGKTIEALVTAHIMFLRKEIKHCLIVCPPDLIPQWISEIETKFRDGEGACVFEICVGKDSKGNWSLDNSIAALKKRMKRVPENPEKLPVFFLSTLSLISDENIGYERSVKEGLDGLRRELGEAEETHERCVRKEKEVLDPSDPMEREELQKAQTLGVLDRGEHGSWEYFYKPLQDAKAATQAAKNHIAELKLAIEDRKKDSLLENTVDLFIVDEADTVVSGAVSDVLAGKNAERAKLMLEYLVSIRKKYCILISATPLRAQLEDIYYLIKIVDESRFADLNAFYTYVGAKDLAELVKDTERVKRLVGLINTMFTRMRMFDDIVKNSYRVGERERIAQLRDIVGAMRNDASAIRRIYPAMQAPLAKQRIERIRKNIENALAIFIRRGEDGDSFGEKKQEWLETVYENWESNADFQGILYRGLRDYYLETRDVNIHRYIDWSRQKKYPGTGSPENIGDNDELQNRRILELLGKGSYKTKVVIFEGKRENRKRLYDLIRQTYPTRKVYADINDEAFWRAAGADTTVTFEDEAEGENDVGHLRYRAFKRWNVTQFNLNDPAHAQAVYLVDKERREGANLNCASRLIICEMKDYARGARDRLLDPLRFEQIIGRLNRVGQIDNIFVHVFLDDEEERALYDLYADKDGLDMLGDGRPEVSFVIPIVTQIFRNIAERDKRFEGVGKYASFIEIFEYCYRNDLLPVLKDKIRELCGILMVKNVQEERS